MNNFILCLGLFDSWSTLDVFWLGVLIYSRVLDLEWNEWCWFFAFNSFAYRFSRFFEIKNRTGPDRNRSVWLGFGSVSVFFQKKKKNRFGWFFQFKTEPNRKCSPLAICVLLEKWWLTFDDVFFFPVIFLDFPFMV